MSPTVEDYWRVVEAIASRMEGALGDDLRSLILTGSLSRNRAVPGRSDLDAIAVFRRGALDDREAYQRHVRALVDAFRFVASSGLPPGHPFHFSYEEELADQDCLYTANSQAFPDSSRIVAGEDVRPQIVAGIGAAAVARCVLFAMRQRFLFPLAAVLNAGELSAMEQGVLFERLVHMAKGLPIFACLALGLPSGENVGPRELRAALPEVDFGVLDEIAAIRRGEMALGGAEEVRGLLRRSLELSEAVNDRILAQGVEPWRDLLS
jgi:hypothetical protein